MVIFKEIITLTESLARAWKLQPTGKFDVGAPNLEPVNDGGQIS